MSDCMRSCKRSAETADMEASSRSFSLSKRKKSVIGSRKSQELESTSPDQPITRVAVSSISGGLLAGDLCSSLCSSDHSSASRCSSNESCDAVNDSLRFVDLEAKSFETEISTCINVNKFRDTTPSSDLCGDSEEMESPEKKTPRSPAKPPSQAEIDEFFSVAEKYEQKRFAEKYNYDIVKDVPLDGRYQWIRLKP